MLFIVRRQGVVQCQPLNINEFPESSVKQAIFPKYVDLSETKTHEKQKNSIPKSCQKNPAYLPNLRSNNFKWQKITPPLGQTCGAPKKPGEPGLPNEALVAVWRNLISWKPPEILSRTSGVIGKNVG